MAKMEIEAAARRRIHLIASHFAVTARDDMSAATHLLPMNCRSSQLNSVIRRGDSRVNFARQGSSSQASFMRQGGYGQFDTPTKYPGPASDGSREAPLYSRPPPVRTPSIPNESIHKSAAYDCYLNMLEPPPAFARPSKTTSQQERSYLESPNMSKGSGTKSPGINVAESGCNYVMTVEIPGVDIDDIRVEIDDQNLTVTGKGSKSRVAGSTGESFIAYNNRREVSQGMYKLIWPLPSNVNKDHVTAEFWNGLLQIVIPKL